MNRIIPSTLGSMLFACSTAFAIAACSRAPEAKQDSTAPTASMAQAAPSPVADSSATTMLRGTVASLSGNQVVIKSDSGMETAVIKTEPFHVYVRGPSTLANVKQSTFIGVTTVKQPDGSEKATEIHIFPDELRGLGEGSRMMTPSPAAKGPASRMTNGAVASPSAPASRMSNGSVASTNGSTLVVQYAGGSQTVVVPPTTPVTELKLSTKALTVGEKVVVMAKKNADGSITADRAIVSSK